LSAQVAASTVARAPAGLAALLALSRERDLWEAWADTWARLAYRWGRADGIEEGRRLEAAERDRLWHEMAQRVARGDPRSYAELERERWKVHGEPRTRETFGLPHPADRRPLGAKDRQGVTRLWPR
jgi:hypothetical protein